MTLPVKGIAFEMLTGLHMQAPQANGHREACADFELNAVECLEAYGVKMGYDRCWKYFEDYKECQFRSMAESRANYMNLIRAKKVLSGELPLNRITTETPPYDSYITGSFLP